MIGRRWVLSWGVLTGLALACASQKGTIGAVLGQKPDGSLVVREVAEGLGADRAGLRAGDQILLIDGVDVRGLSSARVHAQLIGEVGESVKLTVVRGEEIVHLTIKRTAARKRRQSPTQ